MGTGFAVFGRSKEGSKQAAERHVQKNLMWHKSEKRPITQDEYRELVLERAVKNFALLTAVRISPEFDAPQFATDWAKVAGDGIRCDSIRHKNLISKMGEKQKFKWTIYKPD